MGYDALALSLGHNSSAIAIRDGHILGGFEEERFSQKKSDSAFPIRSIQELHRRYGLAEDTTICVSHWLLDGNVHSPNKYWMPNTLLPMFPKADVHSHKMGSFTHHDAHARSAQVFAGRDFSDDYMLLVMDGFGTAGECISVYDCDNTGRMRLVSRVYGFNFSVGMFYQYATAFCGMKMHNHEYKMLAYETRINLVPIDVRLIDEYVDEFSRKQMRAIHRGMRDGTMDPMVSLDALTQTNLFVERTLNDFLSAFEMTNADLLFRRIMVSYFAQRYTENIVISLVHALKPQNLLVVGGVFYNVKLNHMLANMVKKFCVMPLAGDQGAGIGVAQDCFGDIKWPEHLFWGHRTLDYDRLAQIPGVQVVENEDDAFYMIGLELLRTGFVNLVRGAMEYGPRALCHTTTLALPNLEVGEKINQMNDRTNEMPFAMVCTEQQANEMFKDIYTVHKSLEYMICAREFREGKQVGVEGGAHYYPLTGTYTCRPQITRDLFMTELLMKFGPLINTSWNYHGVPIVRGTDEIIFTHSKERAALPGVDFKTIIVKEG